MKMNLKYLTTFLSFFLLINSFAVAVERQIECKVVGISDGDTLTCLQNRTQLKVRLQHIDAPEAAQAYGNRAKQALSALAFKKNVRLHISGYDKYQRLLAVVFDGERNINLTLVQQGMAWAYRETQPQYQQAQQLAQSQKVGLWRDPYPINPAEWRANKRVNSTENLQNPAQNRPLTSSTIQCHIRLSCNKIGDYEQAVAYFRQCGWQELDGNHDGIPCNKLYRKAQRR